MKESLIKRKTKKLLSLILSFVVALSMMPGFTVSASAAEPENDCFCFTAEEATVTTISMAYSGYNNTDDRIQLKYATSTDGEWKDFVVGSTTVTLTNKGDKVYIKASDTNQSFAYTGDYNYFRINGGTVSCSGNIMYLLNSNPSTDTSLAQYCFYRLFNNCTQMTKAPELPATTLNNGCYASMFNGCTGLTEAPELPAKSLAEFCYDGMFNGCTGLTEAPELPAEKLANYCYQYMFNGCTGLTEAPELTATTLADYCYANMFYGCTGLTKAPELPATTLANSCYVGMFNGCTGLAEAPELPATTLTDYCYANMFYGCTGLKKAPELPAEALAYDCYDYMFGGCTGLTEAPELPATTLAAFCYFGMFNGCIGLAEAPELPATTLTDYCYADMFDGCTGLKKAPELPAEALADDCYDYMFGGCTGLKEAPELPAESLTEYCYADMFNGCTGLTEAPELPAEYLAKSCYVSMFDGCTGLKKAPELPAEALADSCYCYMFSGCTGLTEVPELSATTLADDCYHGMFTSCTNLKVTTSTDNPAKCVKWNFPETTAEDWNTGMLSGTAGPVTSVVSEVDYYIEKGNNSEYELSLKSDKTEAAEGDVVTVTVGVSGDEYAGIDCTLKYDNSIFEYVPNSITALDSAKGSTQIIKATDSSLNFEAVLNNSVATNGDLFKAQFKVRDNLDTGSKGLFKVNACVAESQEEAFSDGVDAVPAELTISTQKVFKTKNLPATVSDIAFDGAEHPAFVTPSNIVSGTSIVYSYKYEDGNEVTSTEIPNLKEKGKYLVKYIISAPGYKTYSQTFELKVIDPDYYLELVPDYVNGKAMILVFSNVNADFKYNGKTLFQLLDSGYTPKEPCETTYTNVYALITSNPATTPLSLEKVKEGIQVSSSNNRITISDYNEDVNISNKVDLNDAVAAMAVYNVNPSYFESQMGEGVILRADVNRDKKVDTDDIAEIFMSSNYGKILNSPI